jgi:hypothetical protein
MPHVGDTSGKLQSCLFARPLMKLTGKEDEAMMRVVAECWDKELAAEKCWAVVHVEGRGDYLVRFQNRPSGDYHAVCAAHRHQGSACGFPCLWCEGRNTGGNTRLCAQCGRYCCHHRVFSAAAESITGKLKSISGAELVPEPDDHKHSIDASHSLLQPRRAPAADAKSKKGALTARAEQAEELPLPTARQRTKRQRPCESERSGATSSGYQNPLEPKAEVWVHPEVHPLWYNECSE